MYELIQVGSKTYYIACPSKVGVYVLDDNLVCLIDSGSDIYSAKKIYKVLQEKNWNIAMIINTHSHADHIGGNAYFQEKTSCSIYCVGQEKIFIEYSEFEASYLFGGFPCKDLRNKFLSATKSNVKDLTESVLPSGLECINLDGHSFSQIGIKTDDDVWFLADAITTEEIMQKYHVIFLVDVHKTLESLDRIKTLKAQLFIPSHGNVCEAIIELAEKNCKKMYEIIDYLLETCKNFKSTEMIIKSIFDHYKLTMTFSQNVLIGSTIRSYLSYLYDRGQIQVVFENNMLLWKTV